MFTNIAGVAGAGVAGAGVAGARPRSVEFFRVTEAARVMLRIGRGAGEGGRTRSHRESLRQKDCLEVSSQGDPNGHHTTAKERRRPFLSPVPMHGASCDDFGASPSCARACVCCTGPALRVVQEHSLCRQHGRDAQVCLEVPVPPPGRLGSAQPLLP